MSSFVSLTWALKGLFDKPLGALLPEALRQRVETEFCRIPWDKLSPAGRQAATQQLDYQNDPATEQERRFSWELAARKGAIKTQIGEWEAVAAPTAGELERKEKRLAELRQELTGVEAEVFVEGGPIESPRNPAQPTKRQTGSEHLQVLADTTSAKKPQGSTVRRDAGKLRTLARHKQWKKAYLKSKKEHPNKPDNWHALRISEMDIGEGKKSETIRKIMKS